MALKTSVLQAASNAMGAYLKGAMGADVTVLSSWPEPDQKLRKAVTLISVGERQVEYHAGEIAQVLSSAELSPPDPNGILKKYTFALAVYSQPAQLDVWATSFAACDDLLDRLDDALNAGVGATLGTVNADPFRDGTLVALDPASGHEGFADYLFDGQGDDQTPAQSGRDEWRATYSGTCIVNYTRTVVLPRMKFVRLKLKTTDVADTGDSDLIVINDDGSIDYTAVVP
jgi:hypothetical protein